MSLFCFLRGSTGVRHFVSRCRFHDLLGAGMILKSHVDLGVKCRHLASTRYMSVNGRCFVTSFRNSDPSLKKGEATTAQVDDADANFKKGKFAGLGLPKAVGQPEDLPSIEFGKPTGMYKFVRHQHGDPRDHLLSDGRYKERYDTDGFHWYDAYTDVPKQKFTIVNGESMIIGKETRPMEDLFGIEQTNIPFTPRRRLNLWGNHNIILRAEFCFFWIPTFIILSLAVPCYTMIYMMDEAVATSMTVKVIGHQWYWVYEVESPPVVE